MIKTALAALTLTGFIQMTPVQPAEIPTDIAESMNRTTAVITAALTPAPAPLPIPAPEKIPPETQEEIPKAPEAQPFATILGTSTTRYSASNRNRSTNIRLSATAINGVILQPNESFSFNNVVGKRTSKRGYLEAGIYSAGKVDVGIGGGICQVSSTLFNAALLSNMTITNRVSHGLSVNYLPAGRDATVSWGGPDFVFKNSYSFPVKVTAGYDSINGSVTISIHGPSTVSPPDVKIKVTGSGKNYTTKRLVNDKVNYTTKSTYKDL